ncbi:MAG: ImmA/IrrE family metallo-endopeptidase [Polyangiaceae bacterium]
MTLPGIGTSVLRQREGLGLSASIVAGDAGMSTARLREIESGQAPTTWEIAKLAHALGTDAAALWRGDNESSAKRSTARFRAPSGVNKLSPQDTRLLARLAEAGRILGYLRSQLGQPPSTISQNRAVKALDPQPEAWEQGYLLGAKARFALAPERRPILSIQACLESLGAHVATVELEATDILAASLYEPGAAPVIALNKRAARVRMPMSRRAVLAHELCHLLHDGGENDLLTLVSRQNEREPHEQRANGFAPSFIVPGGWLPMEVADPRDQAVETARTWGLSFEGATWHLKNAGRITPKQAEALLPSPELVSEDGFEPPTEREPIAPLSSDIEPTPLTAGLLSDVVLRAFKADLISRARAVEILRLR